MDVASFEDRVEEVLGLLHGMAWPLLEEKEKRRIVARVAAGIDKGDTYAAWGRALGCSDGLIRQRVVRFRSKEPVDGAAPSAWTQDPSRIRAAKNVLKDPVAAAEVVKALDPTARREMVEAAVLQDPAAAAAAVHVLDERARRQGRTEPEPEPIGWRELLTDIRNIRRRIDAVLLKLSGGLRVPGDARQDFVEIIQALHAGLDLMESGVTSRKSIADEVQEFLDAEAQA
jgi:hypothetical protein